MGDTISSLVFRPPKPTPIHPSDFFYLDVDVQSPLCTHKSYRRPETGVGGGGGGRNVDGGSTSASSNGSSSGCGIFDDDDAIASHPSGGSGCLGGSICLDNNGESDLASLDANYLKKKHHRGSRGRCSPTYIDIDSHIITNNDNSNAYDDNDDAPKNVRNGQVYKIPAFFIRRRNATQTILFSHGNAEDLGMMYPRMKDLALVLGVNVLAYEYTGYGLSIPGPTTRGNTNGCGCTDDENENCTEGQRRRGIKSRGMGSGSSHEEPSENMTYRNIEAAYRYLTQDRKIPPQQIILYGRSLGSGPSCYLAAKTALSGNSVGGLVLHSPFLSVYKVVADLNGFDLSLVGDLFHNEKRAKNIRCPTLIIHGREDEVVPFWHAPRLLATIPPEFRFQPFYVDGLGHNHIESQCRDQFIRVMISFLNGVRNVNSVRGEDSMRSSANYDINRVGACRGPAPIPIQERASSMEAKENHPSFYVNRTWLRHAQVIIKEVFFSDLGGMCHVHNSVSHEGNDGPWKGSSTTSRSSSTSRSSYLSDARDGENEFSPWTSVGVGGSNHSRQSPRNVQHQILQQQQRQGRTPSEKILTPRSNGTNNSHHKSQSLKPNFVDNGRKHQQQIRRNSTSEMRISSPRSHVSPEQKQVLSVSGNMIKQRAAYQRRSNC